MPETAKTFDNLMKTTFAEGALSVQAKELIALGISVAVRCEPCMNYHIEQARTKGANDEKLLEAMSVGFEMGLGQLIPPLRRVLRSQFASGGEGRKEVRAGPDRAQSRDEPETPDGAVPDKANHRMMWARY
jgi:AhpD family alkylhydroperoxidase